MIQFIIRRLVIIIMMMGVMSVVSFAIILAPPGDNLSTQLAQLQAQGGSGAELQVDALRAQYGLDKPVYVQYLKWIGGILQWDLGRSLDYGRPVTDLLNQRLLMTLFIGFLTIGFVWTLAIPIGILSATRQYSVLDYMVTFFSYLGVGTPNFLLALVVLWVFLSAFNISLLGLFSQEYIDAPWSVGKFVDLLKHVWAPVLILGTDGLAGLTRIVRANLLDEMNKPYVETARAKGLPEWKVIWKYPVRIALNPFISTVGWALPALFSGSLILASVMGLNTIGPLLLRALLSQDMYMAGSILFILTALTLVGTLISDILLAWSDPRIRIGA